MSSASSSDRGATVSRAGIHHIHLAETDSTNTYAKQHAHAPGILLVTADHQTAGRGQRGNSWEAAPGKNLLFSLALHPTQLAASQQFVLCELISVALCEVLSRYTDATSPVFFGVRIMVNFVQFPNILAI